MSNYFAATVLIASVALASCGGSSGGDTPSTPVGGGPGNSRPIAHAGDDQIVNLGATPIILDGSLSSDAENSLLLYDWIEVQIPAGSSATLSNSGSAAPSFTADLAGLYIWQLVVNDGIEDSAPDNVEINATSAPNVRVDNFGVDGPLTGFTTNNASALPDITQTDGRYRASLTDNANDKTLHFNTEQGRLDAWSTRFPFEYVARNIGIGTLADSQETHLVSGDPTNFAGVQVHVTDFNSFNSSHVVVGHRSSSKPFTIEGKNTLNGTSSVGDIGANAVPLGRADIRIVGDTNGDLTVYYQQPNLSFNSVADAWILYDTSGRLPGTAPNYGGNGSPVYIGLITYASGSSGVPFVGTCDSITLTEN